MTDKERMDKGLLYYPSDDAIMAEQLVYLDVLNEYNSTKPSELDKRAALLKQMLGACGENCYVEAPFYSNWGGRHVFFGDNVYANFGLTAVDDANIYVGNSVMFAPHVTIATAGHPINVKLRALAYQYNREVHIGNNVWIGAGSIIMPGVTIGDNTVIGAGSVVTKDIPSNVVAVGNPCKVMRQIGERDDEYYFREDKIDWENLPIDK